MISREYLSWHEGKFPCSECKCDSLLTLNSFFDKQDGDFKLYVDWIAAVKKDDNDSDDDDDLKKHDLEQRSDPRPVWKRLFCGLL